MRKLFIVKKKLSRKVNRRPVKLFFKPLHYVVMCILHYATTIVGNFDFIAGHYRPQPCEQFANNRNLNPERIKA